MRKNKLSRLLEPSLRLYFLCLVARQMIIRQSNVTERSLVTDCHLVNTGRSDDNPNGFMIEGLTILENKDLITTKRTLSQ